MRVLATGKTNDGVDAIRTETFNGKEYTVVPVVAIVEQVLQGLNAETPELAQASAFGAVPEGWNGRPVVMNHPRNADGDLVSANSPDILEAYYMGFMFNTHLDGQKLKTEAWLDNERIKELGGEFETTLQRLLEGTEVEVSVGCYVDILPEKGKFSGNEYGGKWEAVVPDHLALLSEGLTGACSVASGCGAPRLNQATPLVALAKRQLNVLRSTPATPITAGRDAAGACCDSCASHNGEPCMSTNENTAGTEEAPASTEVVEGQAAVVAASGEEDGEGSESELSVNAQEVQYLTGLATYFVANAVPGTMTLEDVQKLVRMALRQKLGRRVYPIAITTEVVVYNSYSYDYDYDYNNDLYYQLAYTLGDDGTVTFSGESTPVTLKTEIIPTKKTDFSGNEGANTGTATEASEGAGSGVSSSNGKENEMSGNNAEVISANGDGQSKPLVRTLESYINEAPSELQDVLRSSLKLHSDKKDALIKGLMESGRCTFSEENLRQRDLGELEGLSALANVKTFEGVAGNRQQEGVDFSANAGKDSFIPAPRAFEVGKPAEAAAA